MQHLLATHEWHAAETDAAAAAPVAVLVHGITGWWRTWWRVGPALAARGWRVIAVDLRGHGTSPPIGGVATVETLATDVAAAIDASPVAPVDLILAHSLGAAVSMELAHRRPRLARRWVLEDPPGQTRADDVEFQENLEREVLAARSVPESEIRRELSENPAWLEEDARQDVEGKAACDLEGILASLRANTGVRAVELAPRLEAPALYLIADQERSVLGAERGRLIESLPPQATAAEFDSGHTIHRDRFDAYMATLHAWLEE
ncbi:MAG: alpha/beta fold hydrolase [Candidatus Limnocylindria bacterium]